ncbi:MAG: TonB-dependent receptor, partial [Xanthomonadales bacterium]|nr:TonB-dependent receptor [Xanthomonadales bacterium]
MANIITRRSVDGTEVNGVAEVPLDSGGEYYQAGLITGLNWDTGAFTFSAEWSKQESLQIRDRDFLSCTQDLVFDADTGARIDREDRSAIDPALAGCNQLYADTVLDFVNGGRLIPTPDGRESGVLPGYRPRENAGFGPNGEAAFYEDILNFPFTGSENAIGELERINLYATFDQSFGNIDWDAEFLYSNRQSATENWRQFFPTIVTGAYETPYPHPELISAFLPVMPYPSDTNVEVAYFYVTTGLSGVLPTDNYWSWQVYGTYSRGDGDYSRNSILVSQTGDASDPRVTAPPSVDYLRPDILNGTSMMELIDAVGVTNTGNTVYEQTQVTGILAGDLFQLPAGTLGAASGVEWRDFSIDDQPSEFAQQNLLWGESSAGRTKGSNDVIEIFGEVEVPILAGLPGVEELTFSGSARYFDYDKGGSDWVWSTGLRWQIVPSFALRGTVGTSYRAPALFELFLANQTAFANQTAVDACIDWGESTNNILRDNCAADGIPSDYTGFPSTSAIITSGGGVGNLEPETSDSQTFGFVWTPEFTNLNVAVDYFNIEVNNQIAQLGGASIVSACYTGANFPNSFCDLFTREPGDANFPYNIININDAFVNVNQQTVEGIDFNATWSGDYDWGSLDLEAQTTWTKERVLQQFAPGSVEGFDQTDNVGSVGFPEYVTNFRATARKNDWSVTYFL